LLVIVCTPAFLAAGAIVGVICVHLTSFLLGVDLIDKLFGLALAIEGAMMFGFVFLAWGWAKDRLRFRLRVGPRELQFGGGPFRDTLDCYEIESVQLAAEDEAVPNSYRVELTGTGRKWTCFLGAASWECVEALRTVCTNAIYIDLGGREHLPAETYQPIRAMQNLVLSRHRRGRAALSLGLLLLGWSVPVFVVAIIEALTGASGTAAFSGIDAGFYAIPVFGVLSFISGLILLRKARRLSARIREHFGTGRDNATSQAPIDLSESGVGDL